MENDTPDCDITNTVNSECQNSWTKYYAENDTSLNRPIPEQPEYSGGSRSKRKRTKRSKRKKTRRARR